MILPIGLHCWIAEALKINGLRTVSYPFDWVVSDLENIRIILNIILGGNIEKFCDSFFDFTKNEIYVQNYDKRKVFRNLVFNMAFPHQNIETIKETMTRRFKRMANDLLTADKVTLIFASRWSYHEQELYNILEILNSIRSNVKLIAINAFENDPKREDIITFTIPFPKEQQEKMNAGDFSYDKTVYRQGIIDILKQLPLLH